MVFKEGLDEVVRVGHVDVISALIRRRTLILDAQKGGCMSTQCEGSCLQARRGALTNN